ncbi:DnaJ domain protein (macronuclear) [Tetrahymena thermophila SB210]|uniref:DnaJ domain protein n=1 Tax=Tetrahymena thermophila (strain SB210) TaxID=312017 RepID=Q23G51_TETTS|nr:DnaJ domain protein [Tetrahymena thermophila SB210]EAR95409.1 DnaJ domain protein [Tetrahymena thermophila SB210]|eukprot:XP_001015654.1 DnaJ domain protein [Tetrahymena thermophila SB210]
MIRKIFNLGFKSPQSTFYKSNRPVLSYWFSTSDNKAQLNSSHLEKLSYYELLEVRKDATAREIKQNYLRLAKTYHPDVYKGSDVDRFKFIKVAYQVLKKPQSRRQYDEELAEKEGKQTKYDKGFQNSENQDDANQENYTADGKKEQKRGFSFDGMKIDDTIDLNKEYEKFFSKPIERQPEEVVAYEDVVERQMSMDERVRHEFTFIKNNENEINFRFGHQHKYQDILNENIDIMNQKAAATDAAVDYVMKKKEKKARKLEKIALAAIILISIPIVQQALERRHEIYKRIDKGSQLFLRVQEDQDLQDFHNRLKFEFKDQIQDQQISGEQQPQQQKQQEQKP